MIISQTTRYAALALIGSCAIILAAKPLMADDGQPIAIRHWGGDAFTVETMWGFEIGLGVDKSNLGELPRKPDLSLSEVSPEKSKTLQRLPNQTKLTVSEDAPDSDDTNIAVVSRKQQVFPSISVDGLTVVDLNDVSAEVVKEILAASVGLNGSSIKGERLAVIATGDGFDETLCNSIADSLKPRLMIVNSKVNKIGEREVEAVPHNTVAVSNTKRKKPTTRFVSLGTKPYQMSKPLADLFAKKEAACEKSRSVFAKLSVDQMNFKPANGTHTPRWNSEHMMGRELVFFSQIYHAVDPEVPVMNLNPAQMPSKYKFAHEDWTGQEEALQTQRVEAFTRRFAYLLDGMSLNKRAKGSRFWTPKSLLAQMQRHYKEHTDNVVDKMKLEGWPEK